MYFSGYVWYLQLPVCVNNHIHVCNPHIASWHYNDVIISTVASQITSLTIVYSIVHSGGSKKTSKLCVTGLFEGNSPATGKFPAQMASNAEYVSIWWRHQGISEYSKRTLSIVWPFPLYSISQEICTRFLLCCAVLWLYIDWFSYIHQAYFTGTVAI